MFFSADETNFKYCLIFEILHTSIYVQYVMKILNKMKTLLSLRIIQLSQYLFHYKKILKKSTIYNRINFSNLTMLKMVVLRLSQYFIKLTRKKKENIKLIAKTVFLKTQNLSLNSMENKTQSIRISHYFPFSSITKKSGMG